jgi:predicted PurR-regulated permease PerM
VARDRTFVVLIALVTLAFGWVLWPLFGANFWAVAFVIVLDPIARRLSQHLGQRRNLAALIMITGFLLLIILPTLLILTAVIREATGLIAAVHSGEIDLHQIFQSVLNGLPAWSKAALQRLGLGDLTAVQRSIADSATSWFGTNAPTVVSFGQNTAGVFVGLGVMLYLMFFLFRDGDVILERIKTAIPMEAEVLENRLTSKRGRFRGAGQRE